MVKVSMGLATAFSRLSCCAAIALLSACGQSSTFSDGAAQAAPASVPAPANPGALAFSASNYTVSQAAGSITVTVDRTNGSDEAVTVDYTTNNGTATGANYTPVSGTLSWAAGDASGKTIEVPLSATPFSGTLSFDLVLSQPGGGATIGTPASATVSITGNGAPPANSGSLEFSAPSYAIAQSAKSVTVTVSRSGGSSGAVTVAYATSDGTAVSGTNYTATSGSLNWAAGDTSSKTFAVPVSATAFSGTLSFSVALSQASGGATLGTPATATVSVTGSGAPPVDSGTLEFSAPSYAIAQSAKSVTVSVSRSGGSGGAVTVAYATSNGTAISGANYTAKSGTLNWAAGDTSAKTFAVPISATAFNGTLSFSVSLSQAAGGATLGTPATAIVSVAGSGVPPANSGSLEFSASSYSIAQSAGSVTVSVSRSGGSSGAVTVDYATSNGTAVSGTNYTATSGALNWASGDTSAKTFVIPVSKTAFIGSLSFDVTLSQAKGGATLGTPAAATVSITGSGAPPGSSGKLAFSASTYAVNQSVRSVTVSVNRSGGSSGAATVAYATSNGTAVSGTNYTATSGTLNWAAGDASAKTFSVLISTTAFNGTLSFSVALSTPTGGATLGTPTTATVSVTGSGVPPANSGSLEFSASSYSIAQSTGSVSISVSRSGGSSGAVTVAYATSNGTAVSGTNYTAASGTLNWGSGDTSAKSIAVPLSAIAFNGTLSFSVALSTATGGANLGTPATATVSITGSGVPPANSGSLEFSASTYSIAQSAGSVTISVSRSGGSSGAVTVAYATSNGTAVSGKNYTAASSTLNWAAGDASAKTFAVPVSTTAFAGSLSFSVALSTATGGATLGAPATATVSITGTGLPGTLAFAASTYALVQSTGSVTLAVNRSGGSSGAVTVAYATSNGTAAAGMNYTSESGTLSWAAADATPKTIVVPISSTVISGPVNFTVSLSQPTGGATIGTPASSTVTINPSSTLSIAAADGHFVDGSGATVQLRGVNVAGLEGVAIQGWDPSNPWGGDTGTTTPNWSLIKTWGANAVRLPINEASWLGKNCVDVGGYGVHYVNGVKTQNSPGEMVSADPGGNYQATVSSTVASATAAGLYVILDLHLAAPSNVCPNMQNAMADADNSITFWTSFATAFKGYPNVIFELFNEPFLDQVTVTGTTAWPALINGGTLTSYRAQTPTNPWYTTVQYTWQTAGMQQMLNAVRATGATNVILTSTLAYSSMMTGWLQYHPTDTLNPSQLGAVWHAYPAPGNPSAVNCIGFPACASQVMSAAQAIVAAGYPVVVTEYGDPSGGTNTTAPWSSVLLPFADTNGISYMGWTWDPWIGTTYYLITDAAGDPSAGFGTYVKAHYQCRAAGTATCP